VVKRRFFTVAAALAAVVSILSSAGTAATKSSASRVDLSSAAAVNTYLQSIGVNPATVVVQRGANNYAGPFCPGTGWNCTTATSVVQVATAGGQNLLQCGDPSLFPQSALTGPAAGYLATGRCLAIQGSAAGTNTVDIRKSRDNGAALTCGTDGLQETENGQNHFNCHLIIHVSDNSPTQTATEDASVDQLAAGGGNHSVVDLEISLTSALKCATPCSQSQNAWQRVVVNQTATGGAENHSSVQETQYLRGKIAGVTSSDQSQNTDQLPAGFADCVDPSFNPLVTNPNSCANINQSADGGRQESQLSLLNDLDARTSATSGSQTQGDATTGLDGTVPQPTSGSTDTSHENYNERQDATAGGTGVTQSQTAPQSCCALQLGSAPNSLVNADQSSVQDASTSMAPLDPLALAIPNPLAEQATSLAGKIETDGSGTLTHDARQNEGSQTAQCTVPGSEEEPACALETVMVNGQPFTCPTGYVVAPNPEPPPVFVCQSIIT
jgi:hypothetical protein